MKKFLTKRNLKRVLGLSALLVLAVVLTGCSTTNGPIDPNSSSFWDKYILYNMSSFLLWIAKMVNNSYGWAIVIFTIIVRVVLLPLNAMSIKNMKKTQDMTPQLDALKKKYSSKDQDTQKKLQEETQKLYSEAGVNPAAGCLPMLLQLPVMFALYQTIFRTPQLQDGTFLWMKLGSPDPIYLMPILAAVFTFLSSYISQMSTPASSQNTMTKMMTYVSPLIIAIPAISFPTAISLYWVISNAFQVVQTFVLQNPFKYQREIEAREEAERNRKKDIRRAYKRAKKR